MSHDRDLVARNTSVLLALITLVMIGVVIMQHFQIREMRSIDCSAHKERQARVMLYDSLIDSWQREPGITPVTREAIVVAYRSQRLEVKAAADASAEACEGR